MCSNLPGSSTHPTWHAAGTNTCMALLALLAFAAVLFNTERASVNPFCLGHALCLCDSSSSRERTAVCGCCRRPREG